MQQDRELAAETVLEKLAIINAALAHLARMVRANGPADRPTDRQRKPRGEFKRRVAARKRFHRGLKKASSLFFKGPTQPASQTHYLLLGLLASHARSLAKKRRVGHGG